MYKLSAEEPRQKYNLVRLLQVVSAALHDVADPWTKLPPQHPLFSRPHPRHYATIIQRIYDEAVERGLWELLVTLNPKLKFFVEPAHPRE